MKHLWDLNDIRNGMLITDLGWNTHTPVYALVVGRHRLVSVEEYDAHNRYVEEQNFKIRQRANNDGFSMRGYEDTDYWKFNQYFVLQMHQGHYQPFALAEWGDGSPEGVLDYLNRNGRLVPLNRKLAVVSE